MRKMLNDKSFWIILIISLISLIGLTTGVIFLTRKSSKEFYSAGYIIDSTASKTDKYYFGDNTIYKENVFDEYVFKNTDNKEVKSGKNNFIHYNDKSLSFMKNGVILDLDGFNKKMVPYYNITDKVLIKYTNGSYTIDTSDKTLIFNNILGRISDNKYIIVGNDVRVKLAGNDNTVSGDYFEISFIEDGIVKIENEDGSYQTVSEGTTVYVNDNIRINLGDKSVLYNDEEKLILSEMTIDGNENIDIKPEGKVKKENSNETGGSEGTNSGTTDNKGNNNGNGTTLDDGDFGKIDSIIKKEISVDLVSATVDSNTLKANFQIVDTLKAVNGDLTFLLRNMKTGDIVSTKTLANDVTDVQNVIASSLTPGCDYFMSIVDNAGAQYFQKAFRTDELDLRLKRELVTSDSISYSIDFGTNKDIKSVNLSLYDESGDQVGETYNIVKGDTSEKIFYELEHNKVYNAVVDSIVLNNTNYASIYTINTSDSTLKEKPIIGNLSAEVSDDGEYVSLLVDEINDPDESIVKYIYEIYDVTNKSEDEPEVKVAEISDTKLRTQTLKVGENNIISGNSYAFKVTIEYYDNYKYNEATTGLSNNFKLSGKPFIEFENESEDDNFNSIKGKIKLVDDECIIPLPGRQCDSRDNKVTIRYYYGSEDIGKIIHGVTFDPITMEYDLDVDGLLENKTYHFEVYAGIKDADDEKNIKEAHYIDGFTVSTSKKDALKIENWKQNDYSYNTPISVNAELVSTTSEHYYGDKISSITFNLYSIDGKERNLIGTYTDNQNIEDKYYNKKFTITSNMLGISSLDELRELSGGKLKESYLIEVTDAKDYGTNIFEILDNKFTFKTPAMLLLEDKVSAPEIVVEEITNAQTASSEYREKYGVSRDKNLGDDIVRGYKVTVLFNKESIDQIDDLTATNLNFYVYDDFNRLVASDTIDLENNGRTKYFFLGNGTDYYNVDTDLRRGNAYTFSYDIDIDSDFDGVGDSKFPSNKPVSEKMISLKESPKINMFVDNSTANSITYKYKIIDYDNALYKEKDDDNYNFYYKVNDEDDMYSSEIEKTSDLKSFVISNLSNSSIYNLGYYRADTKNSKPSFVDIGSFFFDGEYDGNDYGLGYRLEYGNFDNRLKIIINDNEFLNRVSTYLLTLSAGDDKYQKVVTNLSTCEEEKCIIVDYADIVSFKGKNVTVSLDAFYDNGNVGFSQQSKLGSYFNDMGLVSESDSNKLGFVYQTNGSTAPGQYLYVKNNGAYATSERPKGILGFELIQSTKAGESSKLKTSSVVSFTPDKFVSYGEIMATNNLVGLYPFGIYLTNDKYYVNPKVLDKVSILTDNNKFKFTSITPKVSTTTENLINGTIMDINLSIDSTTLDTDFVKTDGKYKFYVDIYEKNICSEDEEECSDDLVFVKTVDTDYDNLEGITIEELNPDSTYYYSISADMNKNGSKVKTPLFDYNRQGYVKFESKFSTLGKDDILKGVVNYEYSSNSTSDVYTNRQLNFSTYLKNNVNFDIKYELYDTHEEGNETLVFEGIVPNSDITTTAKYSKDITDLDLVYGNNYYTLKVYAVTTDLGKKLELFDGKLSNVGVIGQYYHELREPSFVIDQEAIVNMDSSGNNYGIEYTITTTDEDRVIKDGIYHVELQVPATNDDGSVNACASGHEDDCRATINLLSDGFSVTKTFNNLMPDKHYEIYVYADTYMNNASFSFEEKNKLIPVRKTQYTKSDLGFSLGVVSATAKSENELVVLFTGGANISNSIVGMEYSISVQGGTPITSGKLGKTSSLDTGDITFGIDRETNYSTISIPIPPEKKLSLRNRVQITYYYRDSNNDIVALKIGNETSHTYTAEMERK